MNIKRPQQILLAVSSLVASAFGLSGVTAPRSIAELDALIAREVSNLRYPGFAVAIVKDGRTVFSKGYGVSNLTTKAPVTADTPFMVASVSKVVTGTALMQLVQIGKIDLDEDIHSYLPFKIVNLKDGTVVGKFKGPSLVYNLAMSPDGRTALGSMGDSEFTLWDTQSLESFRTLKGHTGQGFAVAYSADGKPLATGSSDKTARLWNAATGKEIRVLKGHDGMVRDVAFSPDGKYWRPPLMTTT